MAVLDMSEASEGDSTQKLAEWIHSLELSDVPEAVQTRAKHIILDAVLCLLFGAHLSGSERAAKAVFSMEGLGRCTIAGWDKKIGPLAAAITNSTFIQSIELDDYFGSAPIHISSVVIPAILAAWEHVPSGSRRGADFLLAAIVGYEVGPRVGLSLHGRHFLARGWHSGAVFGPAASASAVSKLLQLPADKIEGAIGMGCTQASGLMSVQYESDFKRMQHGVASRSGLFAALLAHEEYRGVKKIFDRKRGGYLSVFGQTNRMQPESLVEEITKDLGTYWQTEHIFIKPYASMASTHATVDCIRMLQEKYPERMDHPENITCIFIECGEAVYGKGTNKLVLPIPTIAAQASNAYVAAVQLLHRDVGPRQFRDEMLNSPERLDMASRVTCICKTDLPGPKEAGQRVTIVFKNSQGVEEALVAVVEAPIGAIPPLTNEQIQAKWRNMIQGVIDDKRRELIESLILNLEKLENLDELLNLLSGTTENVMI